MARLDTTCVAGSPTGPEDVVLWELSHRTSLGKRRRPIRGPHWRFPRWELTAQGDLHQTRRAREEGGRSLGKGLPTRILPNPRRDESVLSWALGSVQMLPV